MRCIKPYLASLVNQNYEKNIWVADFWPKKKSLMGSGIENFEIVLKYGGETQDRTGDTRIFNPLLYLLSYHADVAY